MDRTAVPFATITEMAAALRAGSLSAVALAEATLERIAALDKRLHAFIGLTRERALAEARAAEALLRAGHDVGPLQGIPYAVKDLYDVAGQPTTAGTRLLADRVEGIMAAKPGRLVKPKAGEHRLEDLKWPVRAIFKSEQGKVPVIDVERLAEI